MERGKTKLLVICIAFIHLSNASENLSRGKPTNMSSIYGTWSSDLAVDGCKNQNVFRSCCMHTSDQGLLEAWWWVDLEEPIAVGNVLIYYRDGWIHRLGGYEIILSNTSEWAQGDRCYIDKSPSKCSLPSLQNNTCQGVAQFLTIYVDRRVKLRSWYSRAAILELCEIEVYGCPVGYYGTGNCNSSCDVSCVDRNCHPSTGICLRCSPGYYKDGQGCSECKQHCPGVCDGETGVCAHCPEGTFGDFCKPCPSECASGSCAKKRGHCEKGCVTGKFGAHCNKTCPENCRNGMCEQTVGTCADCKHGKYGFTCEESCPGCCEGRHCLQADGTCAEKAECNDCSALKVVFPVLLAFVIVVCAFIIIRMKQRYTGTCGPAKLKEPFYADNKSNIELEQPNVYSNSGAVD
ncbi:cell death abnormality protein 1-like [Mizuhopecten yessoensis]|uniref:Scavenger receptor class F member 1 n=1 Tax=Mizuhopecten yessoensis TaxID=6573 RepID=A0A210PEA0_MIZYE|nr:cell death abnormality protein 1-like [Mizuhopecten yessoensis]OWF34812.1 Scavenger receptor class F member 1 [Mizuhopecten yessoensis]